MSLIYVPPYVRATDSKNEIAEGARRWFYRSGTTVLATVFADSDLDVVLPQPLSADISGIFPNAYLDPETVYRVRDETFEGVLIGEADPVYGADPSISGAVEVERNRALQAETALGNRITVAEGEIDDLQSMAAAGGTLYYPTWAALVAATAAYNPATAYTPTQTVTNQGVMWVNVVGSTGVAPPTLPTTSNANWTIFRNPLVGQAFIVPISDAGTHTDPAVGGTVANSGVFSWQTGGSGTGPRRLFSTDAALAKPYADAAAVSEANAAASAVAAAASAASISGASGDIRKNTAQVGTLNQALQLATYTDVFRVSPTARYNLGTTGDYMFGLDADTTTDLLLGKIAVGESFNGIGAAIVVNSTTSYIRVSVYERATADPQVDSVTNFPIVGYDTLIGQQDSTPASVGVVPAVNTPVAMVAPIPIQAIQAGKTYMIRIQAFNASNVQVQLDPSYFDAPAAVAAAVPQRRKGWRRVVDPSVAAAFTAASTGTRFPTISLHRRTLDNVVRIDTRVTTQEASTAGGQLRLLQDAVKQNDEWLFTSTARYPVTMTYGGAFYGASIYGGATLPAGTEPWVLASDFTVNAFQPRAEDGTTSTRMIEHMLEFTPEQRLAFAAVNTGGNNDLNAGLSNAQTAANLLLVPATLGHSRVMITPASVSFRHSDTLDILNTIRPTLGGKAFDPWDLLVSYSSGSSFAEYVGMTIVSSGDMAQISAGDVPASFLGPDDVHLGPHGSRGFSTPVGRVGRVYEGRGVHVHMAQAGIRNNAALNSTVYQMMYLGDVWQWSLIGHYDDVVRIDPLTGLVTRGAGVVDFDCRDIWIEASNRYDRYRTRLTLFRLSDTTLSQEGIRPSGGSAHILEFPRQGPAGAVPTKELTIFVHWRPNGIVAPFGRVLNGQRTYLEMETMLATQKTAQPRLYTMTSDGTTVTPSFRAPAPIDSGNWHGSGWSVNTATGYAKAFTDNLDPVAVTPVADALINLPTLVSLFGSKAVITNTSTSQFRLMGVDIGAIWIADKWFDFDDPAVRALWMDLSTGLRKDLGTTGMLNNGSQDVYPLYYGYGPLGNWRASDMSNGVTGGNYGTGGKVYPRPYIAPALLGVSTVS